MLHKFLSASTSDSHRDGHVGEVTVRKIRFQFRVQRQTMELLSDYRIEVTSLSHSSSIQSSLLTQFKASINGERLLGKRWRKTTVPRGVKGGEKRQ